ncbi:methyltransferase domain-containing protein [Chloroflexales bacterium ZM16-3]|nr:methyltransferase domain-containing protein [Chloroflexales bacterium ZM16-3]
MGINTLGWNRIRYRAYVPIYDLVAAPFQAGRRQAITALDLRAGERVLILGCGTGLDLPLLPAGLAVTAIDLTPAMVRRTLARAAAIGRPLRAAVMNGQQLALPDAAFDVVLLHLVLAVVPNPIACAREVARVLRPGGRAAIFDKWLPEGGTPSPARRALNAVTATAFSDINRQLNPILATAGLKLASRAPAGMGGIYQVAIARRQS